MTTYNTIASTEVDSESPVVYSLMKRLRDNPLAIVEGSTGAPRYQTAALNQVVSQEAVTTNAIRDANVTTSKIGALAVSVSKLSAAVSNQLVSNGDTHDHAGGDGQLVETRSITNNSVRNTKIYKGVGASGSVSVGAGATYTPNAGLYVFAANSNSFLLQLNTTSFGWRTQDFSDPVNTPGLHALVCDGVNQRIYNPQAGAVTLYFFTQG